MYPNVGIKVKGDFSLKSVRATDSNRYSFKIKADAFGKQSIAGLDTFAINAVLFDAPMVREYLSYDMLKQAGVKTPLFSYANIYENGEYWGFYLIVEGIKESFIKRNYGEMKGNLYRPEGTQVHFYEDGPGPDLSGNHLGCHLEYVGDDIYLYDEIINHPVVGVNFLKGGKNIVEAIKHLDSGTDLDKYMNMDEIIAYLAVNAAISNLDSYYSQLQTHNFFIYENDGKVTLFPWDFDISFATFYLSPSEAVNLPIDTPVGYIRGVANFDRLPLIQKVVENPFYREKYHNKLRYIAENLMGDNLLKKIDTIVSKIRPYVENDPHISFKDISAFDNAVVNLKKFVDLRTKSLLGQLDGTIPQKYFTFLIYILLVF